VCECSKYGDTRYRNVRPRVGYFNLLNDHLFMDSGYTPAYNLFKTAQGCIIRKYKNCGQLLELKK